MTKTMMAGLAAGLAAFSLYADKPLQDDDPYRYYRW